MLEIIPDKLNMNFPRRKSRKHSMYFGEQKPNWLYSLCTKTNNRCQGSKVNNNLKEKSCDLHIFKLSQVPYRRYLATRKIYVQGTLCNYGVLVHPGCYNKMAQTGQLINNRNRFLTVRDTGSPKSRCQMIKIW